MGIHVKVGLRKSLVFGHWFKADYRSMRAHGIGKKYACVGKARAAIKKDIVRLWLDPAVVALIAVVGCKIVAKDFFIAAVQFYIIAHWRQVKKRISARCFARDVAKQ